MATNSFLLNPFTGAPAKVNVTLTDNGSNQVEVKLDVVSGYIADIVGFFANFNNGLTVGNISALGRSATAALLNATSDELNNYVKGSNINYIIDEDLLSPNDRTFLSTKVDGIFDIDGSRIGPADGIISSQEVINAVKDVFTIGGGLYGALDVNTLATAFDKMNNMGGG